MERLALFILLISFSSWASLNGIFGGTYDSENSWPQAVAIGASQDQIFCSGVLVERNKVLTAAHCVLNYPGIGPGHSYVFFGVSNQLGWKKAISAIRVRVPKSYNENAKYNQDDFALVILKEDAPQSLKLIPVLTAKEAPFFFNQRNPQLVQVGFGTREDRRSGEKYFTENTVIKVHEREYEAGRGTGHGVCYGDSGGPSFGKLPNGEWRIVGITSRTPIKNGNCYTYGQFFGRADAAHDWYTHLNFY